VDDAVCCSKWWWRFWWKSACPGGTYRSDVGPGDLVNLFCFFFAFISVFLFYTWRWIIFWLILWCKTVPTAIVPSVSRWESHFRSWQHFGWAVHMSSRLRGIRRGRWFVVPTARLSQTESTAQRLFRQKCVQQCLQRSVRYPMQWRVQTQRLQVMN